MAFNKREYDRKYYQEHKEHYTELGKEWRKNHRKEHRIITLIGVHKIHEKKRQMILNYNIKYLRRHKKFFDGEFHCPKCGKTIAVTQVHNHHTNPENKLFNIAQGINKSYEELTNELPKTIPICPECHKIITAKERGHRMFNKYNSIPSADLVVKFAEHVPHFERKK